MPLLLDQAAEEIDMKVNAAVARVTSRENDEKPLRPNE